MKKIELKNWLKQNWGITVVVGVILIICIVVWHGNDFIIGKLGECGDLLYSIAKPVCLMLTVILGYPLLKRKLVDGYITKQFDIIHEANRAVRKKCLELREKYQAKNERHPITKSGLSAILKDVKELNEIAVDANQYVFQYSYLIYKSMSNFYDKVEGKEDGELEDLKVEELYYWIYRHIMQVYIYSRSIGDLPHSTPKGGKLLIDRLDEFVVDNDYFEIENLDTNAMFDHRSALLVTFQEINSSSLDKKWRLLYSSCFEAAPFASPFARIFYAGSFYIPPILSKTISPWFELKLVLVGYRRQTGTTLTGKKTSFCDAIYVNFSSRYTLVDISKLTVEEVAQFTDSYLKQPFDTNGAHIVEQNEEFIVLRFSEDNISEYYIKQAKRLQDKLYEENS